MKKLKLALWKLLLKRRYLRLVALESEFDCGKSLADFISPRIGRTKADVNEAIRKCRRYDKNFKAKEIS